MTNATAAATVQAATEMSPTASKGLLALLLNHYKNKKDKLQQQQHHHEQQQQQELYQQILQETKRNFQFFLFFPFQIPAPYADYRDPPRHPPRHRVQRVDGQAQPARKGDIQEQDHCARQEVKKKYSNHFFILFVCLVPERDFFSSLNRRTKK